MHGIHSNIRLYVVTLPYLPYKIGYIVCIVDSSCMHLVLFLFGITCNFLDHGHDRYLVIFTMRNENRVGPGGKFKWFANTLHNIFILKTGLNIAWDYNYIWYWIKSNAFHNIILPCSRQVMHRSIIEFESTNLYFDKTSSYYLMCKKDTLNPFLSAIKIQSQSWSTTLFTKV